MEELLNTIKDAWQDQGYYHDLCEHCLASLSWVHHVFISHVVSAKGKVIDVFIDKGVRISEPTEWGGRWPR